MSETEAIRQLLAREAIRDLVNRYAVAIDSHRVDDIAALFDPELESEKYGTGQAGVRAWYAERLTAHPANPSALHHNIGVHQVDLVDDDHATGVCYMLGVGVTGTTWLENAGIYADEYVRRGDRWYFAHRAWAATGIVRTEMDPPAAAPGALTPEDVWEIYRQHRGD